MTQAFNFNLNDDDIELIRHLMMYCDGQALEYFSSDTFREAGLDAVMADPAHEIGTLFAKIKANGVAEQVGEIPSLIATNNERKVDLWRWNWPRWRTIIQSQLDTYIVEAKQSREVKE